MTNLTFHRSTLARLKNADRYLKIQVFLRAGETYTFRAFGEDSGKATAIDPALAIHNGWRIVKRGEDFGGSRSDRLIYRPSESKVHVLFVKAQTAGSVLLNYSAQDDYSDQPKGTRQYYVNPLTIGRIDESGDSDYLRFDALAGTRYVFNIRFLDDTLDVADFEVWRLNSEGTKRFSVKTLKGHQSGRYRVTFRAPKTSDYTRWVIGLKGIAGTGKYRINIRSPKDVTDQVKLAPRIYLKAPKDSNQELISGKFEMPGDVDVYRIRLVENKWYNFVLNEGMYGGQLDLIDRDGQLVQTSNLYNCGEPSDTYRVLAFGVPTSGDYFIRVSDDSVSNYTLNSLDGMINRPSLESKVVPNSSNPIVKYEFAACDWYDSRGGFGPVEVSPKQRQIYRAHDSRNVTFGGITDPLQYNEVIAWKPTHSLWRYKVNGVSARNSTNMVYKRGNYQGYWTRWARDHIHALPPTHSITTQESLGDVFGYSSILYGFFDEEPDQFPQSGIQDFKASTDAQRKTIREIFREVNELVSWYESDYYGEFGVGFRETSRSYAHVKIGQADLGENEYFKLEILENGVKRLWFNHRLPELEEITNGSVSRWKVLQGLGRALGLSSNTSSVPDGFDHNFYTVMSNTSNRIDSPASFGWLDVSALREMYRTPSPKPGVHREHYLWSRNSDSLGNFYGSVLDAEEISSKTDKTILRLESGLSSEHFFADGTTYELNTVGAPLVAKGGLGDDEIMGNQFNNELFGRSGNDELSGQQGNDRLFGGAGDDHYFYDLGDGDDVINEQESGGNDVLFVKSWFGLDRLEDDLTFAKRGNDMVISLDFDGSYTKSEGKLRIKNMNAGLSQVESLELRDSHNNRISFKISLLSVWENLADTTGKQRFQVTRELHSSLTGLAVAPM